MLRALDSTVVNIVAGIADPVAVSVNLLGVGGIGAGVAANADVVLGLLTGEGVLRLVRAVAVGVVSNRDLARGEVRDATLGSPDQHPVVGVEVG